MQKRLRNNPFWMITSVALVAIVAILISQFYGASTTGAFGGLGRATRSRQVCAPNTLNCDANAGTGVGGCEVDKLTDNNNCGSCGNVCPASGKCVGGHCVTFYCMWRTGSCSAGETLAYSSSDLTNGHISQTATFTNLFCCGLTNAALTNACGTPFMVGSDVDNAHAQKVGASPAYSSPVNYCLTPSVGTLSCRTITSGNCLSTETCMASLYDVLDSHVGDCSTYANRICCSHSIP